MKACPGLRSGIDRCGSLSFAIRPFVNPAPHSSFRRRPESRGVGRGECSAGACPPLGSGWGVAESAAPIRCTKPQLRLFIPWCAGASRRAIAMKACPGLRSGIDRSGSLSFAIRGIPSPFAASLRQSGPPFVIPAKAGIQKGWGGVRPPDDAKNPPVTPFSSSYAAFARPW